MIFSIIGWVATVIYLANHIALSVNRNYRGRLYFLLNLIGASGLVVSSLVLQSWQAVAINTFWAVVSLLSLAGRHTGTDFKLSDKALTWPVWVLGAGGLVYAILAPNQGLAALGWAATLLFCGAYLLFSAETIRRRRFLAYNVAAAFGVAPILYIDANWPAFGLEMAWGTISLIGFVNAFRSAPETDDAKNPDDTASLD
ncbi:hypothetical protein FF098_006370 [Parvularcula flava]|uniref:CBU-0592-like domain-containing protein n=1 Tax=Aquisalinus luteolus TaxID=1566827 RepID=A0A8J3EQJ6_9PROT|nr:hypothetical protein [Aquisalinus luteolus]NHK27524.1 hypothetical protein [Aquisalinus luteolus]GGH95697.1 hypothetical protein GCM10011355_12850 [Aquisalinus luteolus]